MTYWTVPPMWKGRWVAVLASGPSMSPQVADSVRHLPRVVVNTTYLLAPDADVIYASDAKWWATNPAALACSGVKCSIEPRPGAWPAVPAGVVVLRNTGREGYDRDPGCARTIQNSGAVGIQIAIKAGADRVLLLGFDMRGKNWHQPHKLGTSSAEFLARCVVGYRSFARSIAPLGVAILNCTPNSALDCFPKVSLAEALADYSEAA